MKLLELFEVEAAGRGRRVLLVSAAGGLLSATVVVVVNDAAATPADGVWYLGAIFLLVLGLMFVLNRMSTRWVVEVFEGTQRALTGRLLDRLRAAPLQLLEASQDRHARALGELTVVSTSLPGWVGAVQSASFLLCVGLIIAQLSFKALVIWMITVALIAQRIIAGARQLAPNAERLSEDRTAMTARLDEAMRGFKQLKLDAGARAEVHRELDAAIDELAERQRETTDIGRYVLLGALSVYFVFGEGLSVLGPERTVGLGPVLGYEMSIILALCWSPLLTLVHALPTLSRAEAAARAVLETLAELGTGAPATQTPHGDLGFEVIVLEELVFDHAIAGEARTPNFRVGPLDLTLRRGDLILLTGGSGSGKTTLIKLLLGLYRPARGRIVVDGNAVGGDRAAAYRSLFTSISSDPYLFDRLYGLDVSREQVTRLLRRFGLDHEVSFDGVRFSTLDLSSGQRMRLAMVVALLEDRPICVFDEWTAHQDPEMTRMYYDVLLSELVASGKTVVAVSHDDRFFDRADHLVRLAAGRVIVEERPVNNRAG